MLCGVVWIVSLESGLIAEVTTNYVKLLGKC